MAEKKDENKRDENKRDENKRDENKTEREDAKATAKSAADAGKETAETAARQGERMVRSAAEAGEDIAQRQRERVVTLLQNSGESMEEATRATGADLQTAVNRSAALMRGVQQVSWEWVSFAQENMRRNLDTANALIRCRNLEDMVNIQNSYLRDSINAMLEESSKVLQIMTRAASESVTTRGEERREPRRSGASR